MSREAITTGASGGNKRRAATHYGRRTFDTQHLAKLHKKHGEEVLEVTFRYNTLPALGEDQLIQRLPAGAVINSVQLQVTTGFVGGTSLAVGTGDPMGGNLAPEGLVTTTAGDIANIGAVGDLVTGDGAGIGAALADARQVYVTAAGTFSAGEAVLRVIYTALTDRADQFNDDL
jgi:hypothetical protein